MKSALLVATIFLGFASPTLAAVPNCSTTIDFGDVGGDVPGSVLLTAGTCVHAGDKTFGDFTSTGPGTASASFIPDSHFGNVSVGLAGAITSAATVTYDVAVDSAALALGWRIEDVFKDFTLNGTAGPGGGTLSGHSPDAIFTDFSCTRSDPAATTDTCPVHLFFSPQTSLTLEQTVTPNAGTVITGLTDTISQINVPEPTTFAVLGFGLLGLLSVRYLRT